MSKKGTYLLKTILQKLNPATFVAIEAITKNAGEFPKSLRDSMEEFAFMSDFYCVFKPQNIKENMLAAFAHKPALFPNIPARADFDKISAAYDLVEETNEKGEIISIYNITELSTKEKEETVTTASDNTFVLNSKHPLKLKYMFSEEDKVVSALSTNKKLLYLFKATLQNFKSFFPETPYVVALQRYNSSSKLRCFDSIKIDKTDVRSILVASGVHFNQGSSDNAECKEISELGLTFSGNQVYRVAPHTPVLDTGAQDEGSSSVKELKDLEVNHKFIHTPEGRVIGASCYTKNSKNEIVDYKVGIFNDVMNVSNEKEVLSAIKMIAYCLSYSLKCFGASDLQEKYLNSLLILAEDLSKSSLDGNVDFITEFKNWAVDISDKIVYPVISIPKEYVEVSIDKISETISNLEKNLKTFEADIDKKYAEINQLYANFNEENYRLMGLKLAKENKSLLIENIKETWKNLKSDKSIKDVTMFGNNIFIETAPVEINVAGISFDIGKMLVRLPATGGTPSDVTITNLTRRISDSNPHHPHVFSGGKPCWGNIAKTVQAMMSSGNLRDLVSMVLTYLSSVDILDSAGCRIVDWPVSKNSKYKLTAKVKEAILSGRKTEEEIATLVKEENK